MATPEKQRPRLKNLDDLFDMAKERDGRDQESPTHLRVPSNDRYQSVVELDKLVPFAGHPFRLYEGERLDDMVESVRRHGVLVPIIAREQGDLYEILAGHNRVNAARIAGLTDIPAILLKNVSDEEAMIIVVETNLMQRSFSDMSHSEKAAVISIQHAKLFSQGKRNDIIQALRAIENPDEDCDTCAQVEHKLCSDRYPQNRRPCCRSQETATGPYFMGGAPKMNKNQEKSAHQVRHPRNAMIGVIDRIN